jgi:hypothetical protein
MNKKVYELAEQALGTRKHAPPVWQFYDCELEKFAELIIEDCRKVITNFYRQTPLETAGLLLSVDEEILEHFYGVE